MPGAFKSLAEAKQKLALCTTKPANPLNPTAAELNAAIDASCDVAASDFNWGATDSESMQDKALCARSNAEVLGADNYQAAFNVYRVWDSGTLAKHATDDKTYQALKAKGTRIWGYLRETAKDFDQPWAVTDEWDFVEFLTDNPQRMGETSGYIKRRIVGKPQSGGQGVITTAGV